MKCRVWVISALLLATPALADPFPCSETLIAQNTAQNSLTPSTAQSGSSAGAAPSPTPLPSGLRRPKMIAPLGCTRPFLYRGELYTVDSPQAEDAKNLRFFTQKSAEAQRILDQFQDNRSRTWISAYAGTTGLLLAIFSSGIGRWLHPRDPKTIQTATAILGAAVAIEGISYSFMLLRTNEKLIGQATDAYNHDQPKDPIELQFQAGWSF